jgi:hypothetical protein
MARSLTRRGSKRSRRVSKRSRRGSKRSRRGSKRVSKGGAKRSRRGSKRSRRVSKRVSKGGAKKRSWVPWSEKKTNLAQLPGQINSVTAACGLNCKVREEVVRRSQILIRRNPLIKWKMFTELLEWSTPPTVVGMTKTQKEALNTWLSTDDPSTKVGRNEAAMRGGPTTYVVPGTATPDNNYALPRNSTSNHNTDHEMGDPEDEPEYEYGNSTEALRLAAADAMRALAGHDTVAPEPPSNYNTNNDGYKYEVPVPVTATDNTYAVLNTNTTMHDLLSLTELTKKGTGQGGTVFEIDGSELDL